MRDRDTIDLIVTAAAIGWTDTPNADIPARADELGEILLAAQGSSTPYEWTPVSDLYTPWTPHRARDVESARLQLLQNATAQNADAAAAHLFLNKLGAALSPLLSTEAPAPREWQRPPLTTVPRPRTER